MKKKRFSRLSVGCAVLAITTGKKKVQSSVCWLRGSGDYDRKKKRYSRKKDTLRPEQKKRYSRLFDGCAVLAIIITTGKKRYSCLSGGCAIVITTGKKRYSRLFRDYYYNRKIKKIQSSVWRVRDHVCLSCRDRYICISST